MNNCPFSVGDTVRRAIGTSSNTKPGFVGKIKRIYHGDICADLHFECGARGVYWRDSPDGWERVPAQEEPRPAEKGMFLVALMGTHGKPLFSIDTPSFDYWQDAEQFAERRLDANPGCTFGVFKLIGMVSMKPTWSDPQE